jgi:hypothetical protein
MCFCFVTVKYDGNDRQVVTASHLATGYALRAICYGANTCLLLAPASGAIFTL